MADSNPQPPAPKSAPPGRCCADEGASVPERTLRFTKPIFERFRRTRHTAQYFDPSAAPITTPDAEWAIEKATAALAGAQALLSAKPPERFS